MAPLRVTVTADMLHAAWARRRRADWPSTFDATMASPLLSRLVRMEAIRAELARRRAAEALPAARTSPAPLPQRSPARALRGGLANSFDAKRLAAGDRDDD